VLFRYLFMIYYHLSVSPVWRQLSVGKDLEGSVRGVIELISRNLR
jgi:hypothetical protein